MCGRRMTVRLGRIYRRYNFFFQLGFFAGGSHGRPLDKGCTRLLRTRYPDKSTVKIFSGRSNEVLAKAICKSIAVPVGKADIRDFPNGETFVKIKENVRGEDVFVVQSTCPPANQNLM